MCCDTKQKIAACLRQLMQKKPLYRITVSDLMDYAQMRRQSFYYHFQSIYDVVYWYCNQALVQFLVYTPGEDTVGWLQRFHALLESDRQFYKRVLEALDRQSVVKFLDPVLRPQIMRLVFGENFVEPLLSEQSAAIDIIIRAAVYYFIDFVMERKPISAEQTRAELECLFAFLNIDQTKPRTANHARSGAARLVG